MIHQVSTTAEVLLSNRRKVSGFQSFYTRYFFVMMAFLFPIIVVAGFTPSYQALADGSYQPHWFVHLHGAIMSSWLLAFFAQAALAAKGNLKFHRKLERCRLTLRERR